MQNQGKSLPALLEEYLQWRRSLRTGVRTLRTMGFNLRRMVRWLAERQGVETAEALGRRHLLGWQRHLAERVTSTGRPLRIRTINKEVENARGMLAWLAEAGRVPRTLPGVLRYLREPRRLPRGVLSDAEMRGLLDAIATDTHAGYRDRTMLEVLYSSGVRAAELLGLDVERVDFTNATMQVTGKGDKERVVPIGRTALRYLKSYIRAVRPALLAEAAPRDGAPLGPESAVFLDRSGKRMPYHTLRRIVAAAAGQVGIAEPVSPHTFRRSCTTELIRGGAGLYQVKEMLGHESLDTLRPYTRLTIQDLKREHARCHPRERREGDAGGEAPGKQPEPLPGSADGLS